LYKIGLLYREGLGVTKNYMRRNFQAQTNAWKGI
jgi:hypothetical protein